MLILNYTPNKNTNGDHPVIYLPDNEVESFVEQTIESYETEGEPQADMCSEV